MEDFTILEIISTSALLLGMIIKGITISTPSRSKKKWLDIVLRVLNVIAGNIGKDKNADAAKE